ncbi:MAG: Ig-like domain-containing protein [Kofleriaceae bacterium]|nr:Ig-like domain-containing protein [Kofleriaceae bacterium]
MSTRKVFAFGTHPTATEADAHPVTAATALNNPIRIIVDELLVGNNLEEIACRAPVDTDAYSRVPRGATPDDIAKCASAQDVLPAVCKGEFAVCMCAISGGCAVDDQVIAEGAPVGVLDINQDGAADETRMITGAVGLRCGTIDVPINYDTSYWNPSGNQLVPAMGGFDALGPAIVLTPEIDGMPTNLDCQLTFSAEIVDKQNEAICAPAGGDIDAGCNAGDVSAFTFHTEALDFEPQTFLQGQTGINRNDPIIVRSSVPIDTASLAGISLSPAPGGAVTFNVMMKQNIYINVAGGLAANTQYTLTVPTTVRDTFGQAAPAARVFMFTTGN